MPIEYGVFGWSGTDFTPFEQAIQDGSGTWLQYAQAVGTENGCPRPLHWIDVIMQRECVSREVAAERYAKELIPHNQWWSRILDMALANNPRLFDDFRNSSEPVPPGITLDPAFVPQSVIDCGRVTGLAQERPYAITQTILQVLATGKDPDEVKLAVESCIQEAQTLDELKQKIEVKMLEG